MEESNEDKQVENESKDAANGSEGWGRLYKTMRSLAKKKTFNRMYRHAKRNQVDGAIGALLILGALLALFGATIGQMAVGLIAGYVLYSPMASWAGSFQDFMDEHGGYLAFVLIISMVGFAFTAPALALGVIIAAVLRSVVENAKDDDED